MKKLLFAILVSIFCSPLALAQKIYFTDTSNTWSIIHDSLSGGVLVHHYHDYHYIKDSVSHAITYKWYDFDGTDGVGGGSLVREDTVLKKVYLRYEPGDTEIVLFDYNLHLGDTFITARNYFVDDTMTTMINGVPHKAWSFSLFTGSTTYPRECSVVEGIGCLDYPTYMVKPPTYGQYTDMVYCFSNRGTHPALIPHVGNLNNTTSCAYYPWLGVTSPAANSKAICIYPNPAADEITITSPINIDQVTILNLVGQSLLNHSANANTITLDISKLSRGIYFVKLNGSEIRKFIKQ